MFSFLLSLHFLLFPVGEEIKVTDEALIDMATAISGTGPAVCQQPTAYIPIKEGMMGHNVLCGYS